MALFDPLLSDLPYILYHILLFAVVLALGWGVGRLVGLLLRQLAQAVGVDAGFRRTSLGQAILKSGYRGSEFVDLAARWAIYATAVLFAFVSLEVPFVTQAVRSFLDYFPQLIVALVILVVGLVLSDWFGEFVRRSVPPEQKQFFYVDPLATLLKFVLYFITAILALREAGIDTTILYIFAQALAWSIAIAVGVAAGVAVGWTFKDRLKHWVESP